MNITLQIALLVGILLYFAIIVYFLRKKTISLKYTLLWIIAGVLMALLDIFPTILVKLSELLGISTPSNAVFAIMLFFVIVILMAITSIVSKLNEKTKRLVEYAAILEKRIRELEKDEK